MGLTEVERAIRRDARSAAESRLDETRAEADSIIASAQTSIKTQQAQFDAQTRELLAAMERKELAQANQQGKRILLGARRDAIEVTFTKAAEHLATMPQRQREELTLALAARASREIGDIAVFHVNPADVMTVKEAFPAINTIPEPSISGGLIADSADGLVRSELTFETLLLLIRERELPTIARILFP